MIVNSCKWQIGLNALILFFRPFSEEKREDIRWKKEIKKNLLEKSFFLEVKKCTSFNSKHFLRFWKSCFFKRIFYLWFIIKMYFFQLKTFFFNYALLKSIFYLWLSTKKAWGGNFNIFCFWSANKQTNKQTNKQMFLSTKKRFSQAWVFLNLFRNS